MLNIDDTIRAIEYFYKDISNLTVGNPVPFVASYNPTNEGGGVSDFKNFNDLMMTSGVITKIFYGLVTFTNPKVDASTQLDCYIDHKLDFSTKYKTISMQTFGSSTSNMYTSNPVFVQQIDMKGDCKVSLSGYIFALTTSK